MPGAEKPADWSMTRPDFLAEIFWKCFATIPGHRDRFLQAIDLP